jgi:hypothetical protein|tara:strand:+ start:458 stop:766 length:309 start_codon:yes stop_codon:yes gene_type:complete
MKKIILLITIVSPFANADMDNICSVGSQRNADGVGAKIIELNCERNNILVWVDGRDFEQMQEKGTIARFCRFDRTIHTTNMGGTCVLYSKSGRNINGKPITR